MSQNRKNLYYIFNGRFPSEKAHSLFVAKSVEAFAEHFDEVQIIVPRRRGRLLKDSKEIYGLKHDVSVIYLPTLDLFFLPLPKVISFYIGQLSFSFVVSIYSVFRIRKNSIMYSSDLFPLFLLTYFFKETVYEMHDYPESGHIFVKHMLSKIKKIVTQNTYKKERLLKDFRITPDKVLVECNAVDLNFFDIPVSKIEARAKLSIDDDVFVAMYTGHLYSWKGVDTLAEAAKLLPKDCVVYFIGGTEKDVSDFSHKYAGIENIKIIGHRPYTEIPLWQKAADVLVLPNTAKENISKYYTSPMKLFEYMASKRLIIASDIPSVRSVVDESCVLLVDPDNPADLAKLIISTSTNQQLAVKLLETAFTTVSRHTWSQRSKRIKTFLTL